MGGLAHPYCSVPASPRTRLPQLCRFCKAGHHRPRPRRPHHAILLTRFWEQGSRRAQLS
jgi:hypothetical protein